MSKFKVGDRVVCVDDRNCNYKLNEGQTYVISVIDGSFIYLKGYGNTPNDSFYEGRFKIYKPQYSISHITTYEHKNMTVSKIIDTHYHLEVGNNSLDVKVDDFEEFINFLRFINDENKKD